VSHRTGHLISGDFDPIRPKQAMICPDRTIHPKLPGATLLAFDVPSPYDCDLQNNSVSNISGSMTRMCVIGEADPFIARLLKRFAAGSGRQTVVAPVGQDVVELTRHVKPAVVIVEAELPGTMRGWEAVRALRADREICNIPVIICSWLQEADVHALVDEVTGHLQKPELLYEDFEAALREAGVEI